MVGIFDSGAGGEEALRELRIISPMADVCFFADRANAPYGTKSADELVSLTESGLYRLLAAGADPILIACCTASTIFDRLPEELRRISIPIIDRTAEAAVLATENRKIGVISTEATYRSRAFCEAIGRLCPSAVVTSAFSGELVALAERIRGGRAPAREDMAIIEQALEPLSGKGIDTVILGCTHFSRFEKTIEKILGARSVNSARVGAMALASFMKEEGGCGLIHKI